MHAWVHIEAHKGFVLVHAMDVDAGASPCALTATALDNMEAGGGLS